MSDDRLKKALKYKSLSVPINLAGRTTKDPSECFRIALKDALDPTKQPGRCRSLKDMTPEEKAAIEAEYGAPIKETDGSELVTVTVFIKYMTEKAVRVSQRLWQSSNKNIRWLPKKFIENMSDVKIGERVKLRIPRWLAAKSNLREDSRIVE